MKKIIYLLYILLLPFFSFADSTNFSKKVEEIEFRLKRVENSDLNYKIEKDLLKETYSNNYERINLFITIILGVIGILGYLGIRDINTIKKEYEKELSNLREIKGQFDLKSREIENDKKKFEDELKTLIKENDEQNKKIKFIELKEKAETLLKDNNLLAALEFSNAAIEINGTDVSLFNTKARVLCRLNQIKDATEIYLKGLEVNPTDNTILLNTVECLYFAKDFETARTIIDKNRTVFESKANGRLLELLNIIELYHNGKKDELIKIVKGYVNKGNLKQSIRRMSEWDFKEAEYFAHFEPQSELKNILQNIIWYWSGQINGENLLTNLSIPLPA